MVINTAQIGTLLRPGLQRAFANAFSPTPQPPKFSDDWLKQYDAAYAAVVIPIREAERIPEYNRLWEEWLSKRKPSVRKTLQELNPNGVKPGESPRGWHRKWGRQDMWVSDVVSATAYEQKWGVSPTKIAHKKGRRKFVNKVDFLDGTAHHPLARYHNPY